MSLHFCAKHIHPAFDLPKEQDTNQHTCKHTQNPTHTSNDTHTHTRFAKSRVSCRSSKTPSNSERPWRFLGKSSAKLKYVEVSSATSICYMFLFGGVTLIRADHIYANDILYQHKWNEFATQFESAHSYFGGIICLCVQKSFTWLGLNYFLCWLVLLRWWIAILSVLINIYLGQKSACNFWLFIPMVLNL